MFDTLVSPLLEIIQEKLRSNVLQEIVGDVCGLRDDLNEFGNSIRTIQLHLHDAEVKQRKNEHLNNWLRELKDIAYEAEDLLEVLTPEFLRRNGESERGKDLKVFLINMLNQSYGGSSIPTRVKAVRVKSEAIANRMFIFNLEEGIIGHQIGEFKEIKDNELDICGRQEEKDMIIERVVHLMQDQDNLSVHALCGVGGIGKTTLAKLVYEDERVKSHFQLQIWVRVSSDFSINKSVRSIIESMEKTQCDICALDPLQQLLKEKLRDKKFLLVLDDVWTEDFREWDGLKGILRCGSKGSVVLVTTRIEKVAIMMGSINIQHIPFLSEHDSWSMFRKRAFADKSGDETLEGIGKEIVRKCWGIPLAIKALGSLMMYKTTEVEWRAVQDNEIWQLVDDDGILPSLRLAYDDMPPHVKQCFAHCCSFPKDHYMKKDELIQLWMANGFIPFDGNIDLPSAGYSIFQELVSRSFIQDVKKDFRGNTECKMHDLMHDLAQSVMRNETYILERRKFPHNPKILRHLVLPVVRGPMLKFSLAVEVSLRSLCVHEEEQLASGQSFSSFLSKQHYLRVLETNSHNLLDIVCKLSHLRYLVMTCDGLERLPESIVGLYNLQTLKLEKSEQLRELPKNLKCMTNIYFLEIDDFSSLDSMPPKLGDLTCLQRLSVFLVGKDSSHQIHQLKDLDLGGELTIQMLNNVRNSEDAISANLIAKKNLHSLNLSWESDDRTEEHFDEVLEGLKPNPNLENISIEFFPGSRFPHWISPLCLKNLKKISLKNCRECERISPLGQFPVLRDITLIGMDSIKSLDAKWHGDGETSFPALEHLTLERLPNLMEWTIPKGNNHFSSLKSLNIFHCDYLRNLPQNLSVESLCITHCDNFEIPRFFVLERPPEAIQLQYAESKHPKRKSMLNITRRVLAGDAKKDGYSWTKLCQKYILGFRYPRLYYRCTYRHSQGCQASKQVQRAEDDPSMMIITYRAAHNCSPNQNQEITPLQSAIGIKFPEGMGKPTFIENFSSSGSVITSIESNSATKETPQKRNRGKEQSSRERKSKVKGTVRVAATGLQVDDIPTDEFSWRKYGVKPIFGSVYPRAYYKCSTVRGCPARKHVEREIDDPSMWIVTYSGEHSHAQDQNQEIAPVHSAKEIKLPESMGKPTVIGNYSSSGSVITSIGSNSGTMEMSRKKKIEAKRAHVTGVEATMTKIY